MAEYRSLAALKQGLMEELQSAMVEAGDDALLELHDATDYFYSGGTPVRYERTGLLGNTPEVTETMDGDTVLMNAHLRTDFAYNTGKKPGMADVLTLANTGSFPGMRPTVGRTHFWERAKEKIKENTEEILRSHF